MIFGFCVINLTVYTFIPVKCFRVRMIISSEWITRIGFGSSWPYSKLQDIYYRSSQFLIKCKIKRNIFFPKIVQKSCEYFCDESVEIWIGNKSHFNLKSVKNFGIMTFCIKKHFIYNLFIWKCQVLYTFKDFEFKNILS